MDENSMNNRINLIFTNRTFLVYTALVFFIVISGIIMPRSLSASNLETVIREASLLGIVSLGQGIVMLSGGLDISVGNIIFMVIIYGGRFMSLYPKLTILISILCLIVGVLIGFINGIGVAKYKISPVIMTLGSSSILYGLIYIFGGEMMVGTVPESLQFIGKKVLCGFLPLIGVIWLMLAAILIFILYRTTFGRKIYATGNNPRATWFSGINSVGIMIKSYIICDVLAAFTGLLLLGYLGTPTLRFTDIYTMGSIAAVVIGGIEFFQGVGSIVGTIAGAFMVRFMFSFLIMINVPEAGRMIAEGFLILVIVAIYTLKENQTR